MNFDYLQTLKENGNNYGSAIVAAMLANLSEPVGEQSKPEGEWTNCYVLRYLCRIIDMSACMRPFITSL